MSKTKIPGNVLLELWRRSAGRCEFKGCNKPLYLNTVTMKKCNISQCAHIIADSPNGPRGSKDSESLAKDISNLMLLCPECHKYIDHEGKNIYDAESLLAMKKKHEDRMEFLTGLKEDLQAHIVTYGSKIAASQPYFDFQKLQDALLPDFYPTNNRPIELGVNSYSGDDWENYWKNENDNLKYYFNTKIKDAIPYWEYKRIALFALAPMPLLVRLGTLINNKYDVVIYQRHRNESWKWEDDNEVEKVNYMVNRPLKKNGRPVLVLSLSFRIIDRVKEERLNDSIWEITINNPSPDFLKSRKMLYDFGRIVETVLDEISKISNQESIDIYMSAPVACCVELGRVWMQKANSTLRIFDFDKRFSKKDKLALTINN